MAVKGETERRHHQSEGEGDGDGRSQKERRRERERERMERQPHDSPVADEPRSSTRRDSSGTAGRDESTGGGFRRRNGDKVAGRGMDRERSREDDELDGRKDGEELDRWTPHDAESSGTLSRFRDNDRMFDEHRRYDKKRQGRQERTVRSDGGRPNNDVVLDSDVDRVRYRDKEDGRKREVFLKESSLSEKYKTKDSHSRKEELHQSDKAKRDHARLNKSMEDVQPIEEVTYSERNKHDSKRGSHPRERDRYEDRSSKENYEERNRGRGSEEDYSHERGRYRGVERYSFEDEKHESASRKGHGRKEKDGQSERISEVDRKKTENMSAHTDREYGRQRHELKQKVTEEDSSRDGSDASRRLNNGEIQHAKVDKNSATVVAPNGKEPSSKGELGGNEKVLGKSGGVYIPPFKLAQMLKDVKDKSSLDYQRMTWDALRKSINGLVNKVNSSNIKNILPELFSENLIRGRGLFARSCMKSQMASPAFTHVFAALVAVVNTKFPELGELLLKRIILQLRRAFKRNDKPVLLAVVKFVAHLVNQQVAHEILALELLTVLLDSPTDDSVEVAVGFVKECGAHLQEVSPQGLHGIFERFRGILHEGEIDKRVQFMIEGLFAIRKANFQGHPAILPELDLVEHEDQITHELTLDEDLDQETVLDIFKPDPNFLDSEKKYEDIKKEILGEESDDDAGGAEDESAEDSEEDEDEESEDEKKMTIHDETETNLVNLRRTIYLTIMSSVDFEEAGHKLMKIKLEPGQEMELCVMLLECCSQERTYLRYYGLLGQRFCMINRVFQENFDECFVKQYSMIHRLETNKLRNVAKFFAHLLGTDALPWQVLAYIRLTEEDTTSSSRIFIKILFQELSEHLGLRKLNERLNDPLVQDSFDGIFPKDNPKNTRFAINFFTSIGLGGITDSLREYLKNMPRLIMQQQKPVESENEETESSDTSSSESTSESETESSDTDSTDVDSSSDSESDRKDSKPKKKRRKQ